MPTPATGDATVPAVATAVPSAPRQHRAAAFGAARDYWAFAQSVLPAAKAGDADAQYYLSRALRHCTEVNHAYFRWRDVELDLAGAYQHYARALDYEFLARLYARCHRFAVEDPAALGDAAAWQDAAMRAGQPAAQANEALDMLMQRRWREFALEGAEPQPPATAPTIGEGEEPFDLARRAAASGDPEALAMIGDMQGLLRATDDADASVDMLAWRLVACHSGLDCSTDSDWVEALCRGTRCLDTDADGLVETIAGDNWTAVSQRAAEIETALAVRDWDALRLMGDWGGPITLAQVEAAGKRLRGRAP